MQEKNQPQNESWRVFCAIELSQTVREVLLKHIAGLREAVPTARASWSRDSNLHLTLKFLGDVPIPLATDFSSAISRAVTGSLPFSIRLERTGIFPKPAQPRVLWIGINDVSGKLAELHARLENEAARLGFEKEPRPFHPHLTIARIRDPRLARALAAAHLKLDFAPVAVAVTELLVIRSELSSEGSKYTVVSRHERARQTSTRSVDLKLARPFKGGKDQQGFLVA